MSWDPSRERGQSRLRSLWSHREGPASVPAGWRSCSSSLGTALPKHVDELDVLGLSFSIYKP